MKKFIAMFLALALIMSASTVAFAVGNRGEMHWGILAGIETVDLDGTLDMGGNVPVQRYDVYMTMDSLISGLMNGRSDACYINKSIADYIVNRNDGIESELMPEQGQLRFMMGVNADKPELHKRLNDALKELIADGTVKNMTDEWIDNFPSDREPDFQGSLRVDGANETIVVGVTGDMPPIDYVAVDGTPSGFNVALLQQLGQKMGVNIQLLSLASEARIVALASGRIDVAFWINSVDAFQGDFIDGVLLTEPYASSEICMIYTAGQRDRIMRTVDQIHAAENILAVADETEIYSFGHADPSAMDALVSLVYETPEVTFALTQSENARAWTLSLGDATVASGSVVSGDEAQLSSTLTPGVAIRLDVERAGLEDAVRNAEFADEHCEIDGQSYISSAPARFSLASDALYTLKPVLAYLGSNGSIGLQATDMLEFIDMEFAGKFFKNEAGDALYIDVSAEGANGSRARFFGIRTDDDAAYTLLLVKGDGELEGETTRMAIEDGSLEGMAIQFNISGTNSETTLDMDGVSTNFGMLYAPSTRFSIQGQQTADSSRYAFGALGIDIFCINVTRQDGAAEMASDALVSVDMNDPMDEALQASVKQGLDALYERLSDVAPLTGDYLKGIMEIGEE